MHRARRLSAIVVFATLAAAAPAAADGGVIVEFEPRAAAAEVDGLLGAAEESGSVYGTRTKVVRAKDPAALAAKLNRSRLVRFAEEDVILRASATPNDPRFAGMYGLTRIDAPEAWDALGLGGFPATGGAKVGIVDTGVRRTHEDIGSGRVVDCAEILPAVLGGKRGLRRPESLQVGTCADGNGHGTHVAGTIGAATNNGVGVAGVAFNTTFSICKGLSDAGSGSTSGIASCIRFLKDRGAKVISMSLGGPSTTALQQAVQDAWAGGSGALVVAAAGNDGNATLNYPAAYPEVVSVAATDAADARAAFSNANADVEVAAPGVSIVSTWYRSDSDYATISGTSMATPHAAGVGALIAQRFPGATGTELRSRLGAATDDLGAAGRDPQFGLGRIDALQAATG